MIINSINNWSLDYYLLLFIPVSYDAGLRIWSMWNERYCDSIRNFNYTNCLEFIIFVQTIEMVDFVLQLLENRIKNGEWTLISFSVRMAQALSCQLLQLNFISSLNPLHTRTTHISGRACSCDRKFINFGRMQRTNCFSPAVTCFLLFRRYRPQMSNSK